MTLKRKWQPNYSETADALSEHPFKSSAVTDDRRKSRSYLDGYPWRTLGNRSVLSSLPLGNMISDVRQLIDPDFEPVFDDLDETPRFLRPQPAHLPVEDLEYLRAKGALTIPDPSLRKELLRAYVLWVHNSLPLLDLHEFLRKIAQNDPDGNISLLLFQAVMFAGTAFVDIKHLREAGFATRRQARRAFFMRARLLYSFDYEDDRIAILQSMMLMTYWADWSEMDSSPQKDIWHWIGMCNTLAQSIGLHRDPTKSKLDPSAQRLRVRLWWCLYSRDRLVALALRRPMHINEGVCDVPMLRLTDFEIRPVHPDVMRMFDCPQLDNVSHQRSLAAMFIEKVRLCQCLARVLFAQYIPHTRSFDATDKTTICLIPRQASDAELERCNQKLNSWLSSLPKEAVFSPPPGQGQLSEGDQVLYVHSSMLRMIYHAICTALHRPQIASLANRPSSRMLAESRKKIRDAASGTTSLIHGLDTMGLTKYLPTFSLTVVTPAAVVHLTNLASPNPSVRDESTWNFRKCIEVLNELRDIYPAADHETACLEQAVRMQFHQMGGQIPLVIMPSNSNYGGTSRSPRGSYFSSRPIIQIDDDDDGRQTSSSSSPSSERSQTTDAVNEWLVSSSEDGGEQDRRSERRRGDRPSPFTEANQNVNRDNNSLFNDHDGFDSTGIGDNAGLGSTLLASPALSKSSQSPSLTGDLEKDLGLA